ncbi:hypothetical protein ZWY2020_034368 [Hordeum vulgare]|nr:hypothetical protein ZWY2020_034368 [Hordeum vulgare]
MLVLSCCKYTATGSDYTRGRSDQRRGRHSNQYQPGEESELKIHEVVAATIQTILRQVEEYPDRSGGMGVAAADGRARRCRAACSALEGGELAAGVEVGRLSPRPSVRSGAQAGHLLAPSPRPSVPSPPGFDRGAGPLPRLPPGSRPPAGRPVEDFALRLPWRRGSLSQTPVRLWPPLLRHWL